jgi:hypothetical protein
MGAALVVLAALAFAAVIGALYGVGALLDSAGVDPDHRPSASQAHRQLADVAYGDLKGTSECTEDCSGHEAGFRWARDHEIADPSDCRGRSRSFKEGCRAYAEAVVRVIG